MDPPDNYRINNLHHGQPGPHDNDNDFLPFSDLSGFASILLQKGMQMAMGAMMGGNSGGGGGQSAGSRAMQDPGNQKMAKGLVMKLFGCFRKDSAQEGERRNT